MRTLERLELRLGWEAEDARAADASTDGGVARTLSSSRSALVVVAQTGASNDGELTLALCRALHDLGLVDVRAVVANMAPAAARARLARDARLSGDGRRAGGGGARRRAGRRRLLHADGGGDVVRLPAARGRGRRRRERRRPCSALTRARAPSAADAAARASLADAAAFIRSHEELFVAKTERVARRAATPSRARSASGGRAAARPFGGQLQARGLGEASRFERECQQLARPPRVALALRRVRVAAPRRFVYVARRRRGHPVALRLREAQLGTIQKLWRRAASTTAEGRAGGSPTAAARGSLHSTFCSGADLGARAKPRSGRTSPALTRRVRSLALLAAQPLTLGRFFEVRTAAGSPPSAPRRRHLRGRDRRARLARAPRLRDGRAALRPLRRSLTERARCAPPPSRSARTTASRQRRADRHTFHEAHVSWRSVARPRAPRPTLARERARRLTQAPPPRSCNGAPASTATAPCHLQR